MYIDKHARSSNIFVVYFADNDDDDDNNDDQVGTKRPTDGPTPVPLERDTAYRLCSNRNDTITQTEEQQEQKTQQQVEQDLWGVAPIEFLYAVVLDSATSLTEEAERVLTTSISNAIMDSIYQNECHAAITTAATTTTTTDEENVEYNSNTTENGTLRRLVSSFLERDGKDAFDSTAWSRRLAIQSISQGSGHRLRGECLESTDDTNTVINTTNTDGPTFGAPTQKQNGTTCSEFDGTVVIGFDTTGEEAWSFETVGLTVLSRIEQDMETGLYVDRINQDMEQFNVVVASMEFLDSDYLDLVGQGVFAPLNSPDSTLQESSTLSTFGKISIPIIAILFFLMLCFCWCSYSSYGKMLRKRIAVFLYEDDEVSEDDFSDTIARYEQRYPKNTKAVEAHRRVEAQPNDLSKRSSYMDVPHCNKPECRLCRHRSNYRSVSMIGELSRGLGGDEDDTCLESPSLETTLQDLSEIKIQDDDDDDDYAYNFSRTPTYATIPVQSRTGRFSLLSHEDRSPSLIRIVAEDKQNANGFYNEPETVSFVKVASATEGAKKNKPGRKKEKKDTATPSPGLFSYLFGRDGQEKKESGNVRDAENHRGVPHFSEVDEDDRSDDDLDFNSIPLPRNATMLSYVPPDNPKLETSRTSWSLPDSWYGLFSEGGPSSCLGSFADGARFNNMYGDDHQQLRRQHSLEDSILIPVEIGKKRTLTDEKGQIRQEVAL